MPKSAPRTKRPPEEDAAADYTEISETGCATTAKKGRHRRKTSQHISNRQAALDPRLIFLERAAARLILFEAGLLELDEAMHGLLASLGPRKRSRKRSAT
jgi:hypothetical protein